jgi:fermentation-respiration switch protein FrsA (DUF1100 family)
LASGRFFEKSVSETKFALHLLAAAALLLALSSCASAVRSYIYLPQPMPASPAAWEGRTPEEVTATTDDGLNLRGFYWPPKADSGDLIVFFHGQSGNRHAAAHMAAPLAEGEALLVASYRGYGDNPGEPTEAGLYADARAFVKLARSLAPRSRIYVLGYSLGAAPALHAAAQPEVAGAVTLGAFAGLEDVAPPLARSFLPDRFDNRAAIARVAKPILVLHGSEDEVVPFENAKALQAAAAGPVRLLKLEGAGHGVDFAALAPMVWDNVRQMPR